MGSPNQGERRDRRLIHRPAVSITRDCALLTAKAVEVSKPYHHVVVSAACFTSPHPAWMQTYWSHRIG
jgi:hypothetical protein